MLRGRKPASAAPDGSEPLTPEEEEALASGFERLQQEKRAALADPGKGWTEWFYHDASKFYIGFLFVLADAWIVAFWFEPSFNAIGLVATLVPALYLERIGYLYFWHRPSGDELSRSARWKPTWWNPIRFGRWTPEGERVRRGAPPVPGAEASVDPSEFI